jgi:hypothetical protein
MIHRLIAAFTSHPAEVGESYLSHLWFTVKTACVLLGCALALVIHGLFPFLFVRTASSTIERLWDCMKDRIPPASE